MLTRTLFASLLTSIAMVAAADVLRLSEPTVVDDLTETFGQSFVAPETTLSLAGILADPSEYIGRDLVVETKVSKVCQKKGCFFIAVDGPHAVRVSFLDYGFFVPTDTGGKTVTLAGQLEQREVSPAQVQHFSEDMDADGDALRPGVVYELVASGVRIPR